MVHTGRHGNRAMLAHVLGPQPRGEVLAQAQLKQPVNLINPWNFEKEIRKSYREQTKKHGKTVRVRKIKKIGNMNIEWKNIEK